MISMLGPNINMSGNTCVCLAELLWSLIHKMQCFEMYMIKWSHFLEGMMDWVMPQNFALLNVTKN